MASSVFRLISVSSIRKTNFPPLKRYWQRSEPRDRELGIGRIRELFFDPMFFFAGDCSSPPNGRTNVSAKDFLQIRDDAMPNAVAERIKILVRCVLAKFDPMFAHINVDLFAPDTEKRPHNGKIDIVDPAR